MVFVNSHELSKSYWTWIFWYIWNVFLNCNKIQENCNKSATRCFSCCLTFRGNKLEKRRDDRSVFLCVSVIWFYFIHIVADPFISSFICITEYWVAFLKYNIVRKYEEAYCIHHHLQQQQQQQVLNKEMKPWLTDFIWKYFKKEK